MAGNHGKHSSHPIHMHPVREIRYSYHVPLFCDKRLNALFISGATIISVFRNTTRSLNVVFRGFAVMMQSL